MAIKFLNSVNADSGVLYVDADNNRVGIGTTSPGSTLDVRGEVNITGGHLYFDPNGYSLIYNHDGVRDLIQIRRDNITKLFLRGTTDDVQWENANQDPILKINQDRTIEFPGYGSGANTGTATYALSVDANGNIIEGSVQSNPAGVDGTGTVDYLTKWLDGDTLTDSNVYEASGDLVTTLNLKSSSSYPQLKLTDTDNSTTSSIRSAGGSLQHVLHDTTKSHVFYAENTATELMRITGDGKVGIGASNPTTKFHVYDAATTAGISIQGGNAHSSDLNLGDTDDINIGRIKYDHTNDSMQFHTNNAERMRISSAGNLQLTAYTAGYLKSDADGNITVDTSIIEDTLDSVTDRDATTTNAITVGGLTVDTDTLHVNATNNRVGIGTTSPQKPLHVQSANDAPIRVESTDATTGILFVDPDSSNALYYVGSGDYFYTSAKLGIGNTAPSEELHVTGNVRVTGAYYDSNNSPGLNTQILSSTGTGTDWVSLSEIQGVDGTGTANYLAKWSDIDTITNSVVYDNGTNVGIGTTQPAARLQLDGYGSLNGEIRINAAGDNSSFGIFRFIGDASTWEKYLIAYNSVHTSQANEISLKNTGGDITLYTGASGTAAERLRVEAGGNVGIGTTSPAQKLHVAGKGLFTDFVRFNGVTAPDFPVDIDAVDGGKSLRSTRGTSVFRLDQSNDGPGYIGMQSADDLSIQTNNTSKIYITSAGNVGIGTTDPSSILHLSASSPILTISNTDTSIVDGQVIGQVDFKSLDGSTNMTNVFGSIRTEAQGTLDNGVNDGGKMVFSTFKQSTSLVDHMAIDRDGNLQLLQYTTGVLVTDASGNVTASTDYHTQETADARYVNVTGDTMTGGLNIEISASNTQLKLKRTTSATGEFNIYTNTDSLYFHNVGQSTYPMMINSSGNVGIGTTIPNALLSLGDAVDAQKLLLYDGSNDYKYGFGIQNNELRQFFPSTAIARMVFGTISDSDGTTFSEKMRITSAGNVGIGTTNPTTKLYVDGGESTFNRGNSDGAIARFRGKNNEKAVIGTLESWFSSKVGIGTTSPDYNLDIDYVDTSISTNPTLRIRNSWDGEGNNIGFSNKALAIISAGNDAVVTKIQSRYDSGANIGQIGTVTDHDFLITTNNLERLRLDNSGNLNLSAYTQGYLKSDANGNVTVDNSTFLQEEVDTLASVTARGATTSQVTYFNNTVNLGTSVAMTFQAAAEGATYTPTESTVGTSRYFLRFDTTDDASFPYLTNRTPSGAVVIKTGTAAGGAENEHFRIKGGDGIVDAYFTNANVGIGTSSPTYKLDVAGNLRINEGNSFTDFDIKSDRTSGNIGGVNFVNASDEIKGQVYGHTDGSVKIASGGTSVAMTVSPTGDVGIGTTDPGRKLHVNAGTTNHVAIFESTDATAWIQIKDNATASYISNTANGLIIAADTNNEGADSNIRLLIDGSDQVTIDNNGDLRLHGYGAGYLKTDASGNITLDTITSVVDGTGSASYIPKWSDSDTLTDSVIYESSGSIGIGTESPTGILDISQQLSAAETIEYPLVLSLRDDANSINQLGGEGVGIKFRIAGNSDSTPGDSLWGASIVAIRESATDPDINTGLAFFTSDGGMTEQVRIDSGGNIGIGTDAPSHKLTVDTGTSDFYIDEDTNINQGTGSIDAPAIFADDVLRVRQRVEIWDDNLGNNYLDIRDGSTQAIKLTPDNDSWITNDLGLGTTSPDGPLHVLKTSTESVIIENSDSGGNSDDLIIKNTNDRDVGLKLETGGGYYHIALDSNGDDSLVFHLSDINAPNFEFYQNGDLQLHQYGAGTLKTDANGLVYADSSTTYVTSDNGEGIYSFNDTVLATASEDIFSISNQHGAQSFRVTFVCNTSGYSVAKTYEVVHAFGKDPVFFKVVDTGPYNSSSADHDFDVSFTNDATDDNKVVCSITNNSATIDADIVTTVFLGGSPTTITVTAL